MTLSQFGEIIGSLGALGYFAYLGVLGFRQRRPYWTRQSWWRFGVVCAFGVFLFSVALAMTAAVDRGIFRTTITSSDGQSFWILGSLALLVTGAGIVGGMLSWLAMGDPERPFPGVARTNTQAADARTA